MLPEYEVDTVTVLLTNELDVKLLDTEGVLVLEVVVLIVLLGIDVFVFEVLPVLVADLADVLDSVELTDVEADKLDSDDIDTV